MRVWNYLLLICFGCIVSSFISCKPKKKKEENLFEKLGDSTIKVDWIPNEPPPIVERVDSSSLFKFIDSIPQNPFLLLDYIGGASYDEIQDEKPTVKYYRTNFDDDSLEEIIISYYFNGEPLEEFFILHKDGHDYFVAKGMIANGYEGNYNDERAILDLKNKAILIKSRQWGTSQAGFIYDIYKSINGKNKHVGSFTGEFDQGIPKDSLGREAWYSLRNSYRFLDMQTIKIKSKLKHGMYKMISDEKSIDIFDSSATTTLIYIYDTKKDTFKLYNSRNELIEENPYWGDEYWEFYLKNK